MRRRAIPATDVAGAARFANRGSTAVLVTVVVTLVVVVVVVVTVVAVVVVPVVVTQGSHLKVPEVSVCVVALADMAWFVSPLPEYVQEEQAVEEAAGVQVWIVSTGLAVVASAHVVPTHPSIFVGAVLPAAHVQHSFFDALAVQGLAPSLDWYPLIHRHLAVAVPVISSQLVNFSLENAVVHVASAYWDDSTVPTQSAFAAVTNINAHAFIIAMNVGWPI